MVLNRVQILDLINKKIDNEIVKKTCFENFKGKLNPSIITEDTIIFHNLNNDKLYISKYFLKENELVIEKLRVLNLNFSDDKEKKREIFESLFELEENDENEEKFLKNRINKISNFITSNKYFLKEQEIENYLKQTAKDNLKKYLVSQNFKPIDNWNWEEKSEEYKEKLKDLSPSIQEILKKKWGEIKGEIDIPSFYDYLDIRKAKVEISPDNNLYKILKLEIPKDIIWVNESAEKDKKDNYEEMYQEDKEEIKKIYLNTEPKRYYTDEMKDIPDVIEDLKKLLKQKEYVDADLNPVEGNKLLDFLSVLKNKENVKDFWKLEGFREKIKETIEEKMNIETLISVYPSLSLLNEKELDELLEKTFISLEKITKEDTKIKNLLKERILQILDEEGVRDKYFSEIFGLNVNNTKELISESDIGHFLTIRRYPADFGMIFVKNLLEQIQDLFSRYQEFQMNEQDLKQVHHILWKLNQIWANQRITESDKTFLKSVVKFLDETENKVSSKVDEIFKNKEERFNAAEDFMNKLFNPNS